MREAMEASLRAAGRPTCRQRRQRPRRPRRRGRRRGREDGPFFECTGRRGEEKRIPAPPRGAPENPRVFSRKTSAKD
ncbi:sperm protamine P1 family protein [Sutterella parvirubra YIT 11816]|uniref:Sperm protamine P1 family protein n=1 Tax=Sutterella parvirubra YIT 11816 TaxID=762967 RepID=H3KH14_9BURK|nr:sperm protamine P1 family protein [Sutterella parvirubra YIT 11816]